MIIQSAILMPKSRNQPSRECLYAWYPETSINTVAPMVALESRDIYIHNGLDRNLLEQKSSKNELTYTCDNNNTSSELVRHYKQFTASNDRPYHSTETINEALSPPWALDYELKRRSATPNFSSNSTDMSTQQEKTRRLKSAPVVRSLPLASTAVLTIPEPRFLNVVIPVTTTNSISPSLPTKYRASSAKARLSTIVSNENKQQSTRRDIKSAHVLRSNVDTNLSNEEIQQILKEIYGDQDGQSCIQQEQPVQIIYKQIPPSTASAAPVYVYEKSASWCNGDDNTSISPVRKSTDLNTVNINPHHVHRPAVIAAKNIEKYPVVRENSAVKRPTRHHRHYHHSHGRRSEPLVALTPIPQKPKLSLEIDGVKLKYDPKLALEDKSPNIGKYLIDGRLYLIKDQSYNVIENVDPEKLVKYNQNLKQSSHRKRYQTIPMEKFQIPQPVSDLRLNPTETNYYSSSEKRKHRNFIDPNLISENFNVNKMSLTKRPPTTIVYA